MFSLRRQRQTPDALATPVTAIAPVETAVAAPVETAPNPVAELAVDREWLTLLARLSASASDAGTSIGWMTHDASGTAEQARLIAAASEELAATTGEIERNLVVASTATSDIARAATQVAHDAAAALEGAEGLGTVVANLTSLADELATTVDQFDVGHAMA